MANVVEIAIRGIDEATKVFDEVGSTAQKSMEQAEASVNAVDDSINNVSDLDVSTGSTESAMQSAEDSISGVQDAIQETESVGQGFSDRMSSAFDKVAEKWKEITVVAGTTGVAMEGFARGQGEVNATLDRVSIATGISSEALRDMTTDMADATTNSAEQAQAMEMLIQRGIDTEEQFRNIIPELSNFGTATGQDIPGALETADGILKTFGLSLDDVGDNTDQLTRIVAQTDIPLGSLQRNLGRIPDELQAMEFGLDDAAAGIEVFRDRGFESREAIRNFRRAVADSEGDMDAFLENIGLTNDEWEEYQKKVEPAEDLTLDLAQANEDNMTVMEKMNEHLKNLATEYGGFADLMSMLAPILISLGPILKGVTMAFQAFNFVLRMNPIGLIITASTALIAIGILLWQNWDEVSQWLSETWTWIKELAVELFGGLGEYFAEFWEWIKEMFFTVWDTITELLVGTWEWILELATETWNSIAEFFIGIFDWIKDIFGSALDWIDEKTFGAFSIYYDTIKHYLEMIWGIIQDVWEYIKNTFSNALDFVKALVTLDFQGMKDAINNQMENAWNLIKNIWDRIKTFFSDTVSSIKDNVSNVFNNIKDTIGNIWEGVKSTTERIWDGIVSAVKAPINTIIGFINGMINALNGINIKLPKVPDWVPGIGGRGGNTIGFNIPNVPSLATGGVVSEPTLAIVGDAG